MSKIHNLIKNLLKSVEGSERSFYSDNLNEILKYSGKKRPKAIYAAAFLDESSREDLYNWWKMHVKEDMLDRVPKHSHMTIKFKPSQEEIISIPIGESDAKTVKVVGFASDDLGQAVLVKPSDDSFGRIDGGRAHITISASEDAPMGFAYSNTLLEEGFEEVSGPELNVKVGLFMSNGEIEYDISNTRYSEEEITVD